MLTDYYEAKAALLRAQWADEPTASNPLNRRATGVSFGYGGGTLHRFIVDVLGIPEPEPLYDDRGKPIKVFATDIAHMLGDHRDEWRFRVAPGTQSVWHVSGHIAVPTKAALIAAEEAATGRKVYTKTKDVHEVPPTDLAYPLAARLAGAWTVQVPNSLPPVFVPLPPEHLARG